MAKSVMLLDTLAYANRLNVAGFTEEQAAVQARSLAERVDKPGSD